MIRTAFLLVLSLALTACGFGNYRDDDVPLTSYAALDVSRYSGLWYEVARFPVPFQEGCVGTTAEYGVIAPDRISVVNACRQETLDGPIERIEGDAVVTGPGRLRVSFDTVPFLRSPYWVLWVDEDYRTAVVGTPSGRAGWILNRDPQIPADRLEAARRVLEFNGYDLTELQMTPQPPR